MDKQINIWRGSSTPPTIYHLWVKQNSIYIYNDGEWLDMLGWYEEKGRPNKAPDQYYLQGFVIGEWDD